MVSCRLPGAPLQTNILPDESNQASPEMSTKPTANHDLAILSPEARQVLETHIPDYFLLAPETREERRATFSDKTLRGMRADLLAGALGKTPSEIAAIEDYELRLAPDELHRLNTLMQQLRGIGDDFFSWNECMGEGESALTFATIGAYDRNSHDTQQRLIREEDPGHAIAPYRGRLYGEWARYLEDGKLRYAILSDLAGFISGELESFEIDLLNELVPHDYVEGPEHGERTTHGIRWDMQLDAKGDEAIYEALSDAARSYINERIDTLRNLAIQGGDTTVWLFQEEQWEKEVSPDADGTYFVFSSPKAMDAVRPRHLLADCAAHAGELKSLRNKVDAERSAFENMLRKQDRELRAQNTKA